MGVEGVHDTSEESCAPHCELLFVDRYFMKEPFLWRTFFAQNNVMGSHVWGLQFQLARCSGLKFGYSCSFLVNSTMTVASGHVSLQGTSN